MSNLIFKNEEYWLGDKKLIRTTELLSKHKLSPNYSQVPEWILENAREKGNYEHKLIELAVKGQAKTTDLSDFATQAVDLLEQHKITVVGSEYRVHNDDIAGTIDLIGLKNDKQIIIDVKTTSKLHTEAVSWQNSIYAHLLGNVSEIYVLWFNKETNKAELIQLEFVETQKILRLLECEKNGELYTELELLVGKDFYNQFVIELKELDNIENYIKDLQKVVDFRKEQLKEVMKENSIKSIDNDDLKITYVAPQVRTTYDYKKYLADNDLEIGEEYKKETNVKESLRITLKKGKK